MIFPFEAADSRGNKHSIHGRARPDTCPCCHHGIEPKFKLAFFHDSDHPTVTNNSVQAVFQCPRVDCFRFFIADYFQRNDDSVNRGQPYRLISVTPYHYKPKVFPESVKEMSPKFCEIFNDAAAAESWKLGTIVGPGYRKALEFLIKDFLVTEYPDQKEAIQRDWLQNLIRNKIPDANVKVCAERAAWLGNDETHYLRTWNDKDFDDLKTLITLCVNWIESYSLTKKYKKTMPGGKS